MRRLKWITAVTIILSAATMLYVVKVVRAQTATQTITVKITPNSNPNKPPSVDKNKVDLYKSKNQQVEWVCPSPNCKFEVNFKYPEGSPFNDKIFKNANPKSGVPIGKPNTYRYEVTVNGTGILDPMIIVH